MNLSQASAQFAAAFWLLTLPAAALADEYTWLSCDGQWDRGGARSGVEIRENGVFTYLFAWNSTKRRLFRYDQDNQRLSEVARQVVSEDDITWRSSSVTQTRKYESVFVIGRKDLHYWANITENSADGRTGFTTEHRGSCSRIEPLPLARNQLQ